MHLTRSQQEAQLSQRYRATLRVTEYFAKSLKVRVIRNDTVEGLGHVYVPISIPLKLCLCSEIFSVKEWRDLETGGSGISRSLKMAPFDRSYTTFY